MSTDDKVAIVIPAYNEATVVADVIKGMREILIAQSYDYELIVVNDCSTDETARIAKKAGAHIINHVLNVGSGGATATGLNYAQRHGFSAAATMDADGQHDPRDVVKGIQLMLQGDSDLLIGSRLIDASGMSKVKVLGNKGLSFVTYMIFGINVTDSQSGLRVFSKRALDRLKWRTSGYEYCSEMLWRARQQKLKIEEYPIRAVYTEYSRSKGQNNWNAVNIIKSLIERRLMELFGE